MVAKWLFMVVFCTAFISGLSDGPFWDRIKNAFGSTRNVDDSASSYGLPSCYCSTCDPNRTVGKLYNGLCYFITLEEDFYLSYAYMGKHQVVKSYYHPPLLQSTNERLLLIQMANELYASKRTQIFDPLKIIYYDDGQSNYNTFKHPVLVIGDGRFGIKYDNGMLPGIGLLTATSGFYTKKHPFVQPKIQTCSFDNQAAQYQRDSCVKVSNDSECDLFSISSTFDMDAVYNYTVSEYQKNTVELAEYKTYYRIAHVNEKLTSKFKKLAIYPNTKTNESQCLFLDVQGKRILYDNCSLSSLRICKYPSSIEDESSEFRNVSENLFVHILRNVSTLILNNTLNGNFRFDENINLNEELSSWPKVDETKISSPGLRSCYCADCDSFTSAGKIYNDTCYFISEDFRDRSSLRSKNELILDRYERAIITTEEEALLFQQVSSDFNTNTLEDIVGFYTSDVEMVSKMISASMSKNNEKCLIFNIVKGNVKKWCFYRNPIFLKTSTFYTMLGKLDEIPYEQCSFDSNAVQMNGRPRTCMKISNTPCESNLARILTRNYNNVFRYLENQTQEDAYNLQYHKSYFRVSTNSFNHYVNDYVTRNSDKKSCHFIDTQGKTILRESCSLKTKYICEIEQKADNISDIASSSGLRDCICSDCSKHDTVGKVLDGKCYFISAISRGRPEDVEQQIRNGTYDIAYITNRAEIKLVQQLSFEASVNLEEENIFFYMNGSANLNNMIYPPPNGKSTRCVRFVSSDSMLVPYDIFDDCSTETNVLLVEKSTFIEYGQYENRSKLECDFDTNAIKTRKPWFCLKASDDECDVRRTERVNFFYLMNTMDAANMMDYLRDISQPYSHQIGYLKSTYRIDNVNIQTMEGKCLYFDIQGKSDFLNGCALNTSNLCLITKNAPRKKFVKLDYVTNQTHVSSTNTTETRNKEQHSDKVSFEIILICVFSIFVFPILIFILVYVASKFCGICRKQATFSIRYSNINDEKV